MISSRPVLATSFVLSLAVLSACGDSEGDGAQTPTSGGTGATGATGTGADGTGGGSGGDGASSNNGGSGGEANPGTPGCGRNPGEPAETWIEKTIDVGGLTRTYFVYLPAGYDAATPYPIVYQWHGCSGSSTPEDNNVPVQGESGADAIHVRGRAIDDCWDTAAEGPDLAFFDALVPAVEAGYCADTSRRFATGYSSGAFMTHFLSCVRGDMLRGVASIAGGQGGSGCVGQVAALLIHDLNDNTVDISASEAARDRHLTSNECDAQAPTTPTDHPPCVAYACSDELPVHWCQTTGQDHSRQDELAAPAFWDFLSAL